MKVEDYMKKIMLISVVLSIAILIGVALQRERRREPITITAHGSKPIWSMDDLIEKADLIAIGSFAKFYPSRWSTLDGKLPDNASLDEISRQHLVIFTDSDFQVSQYIKSDAQKQILLIRALGGQVGEDRMTISGETAYEVGKTYLLFLFLETGPSADVAPGAYYNVGPLYEVIDEKVVSADSEWHLEDLMAYIEQSLSGEVQPSDETPTTTP